MSCGHNLSCARPACEPRSACASSASHAGGFAAGSPIGRASFSMSPDQGSRPDSDDCAALDAERGRIVEFPTDIFECGDAMSAAGTMRVVAFRALLPALKRIAVHAVRRLGGWAFACAERPECYGVYLIDCDGGEHAFLDFASASNATYAAMRIAQIYRLPVEFGTFAEPKTRDEPGAAYR